MTEIRNSIDQFKSNQTQLKLEQNQKKKRLRQEIGENKDVKLFKTEVQDLYGTQ